MEKTAKHDDELFALCCEEAPDYGKIRKSIRLGANVNAVRNGNTLLSEIILKRCDDNYSRCLSCERSEKTECRKCKYGSDYLVNNELPHIVRIFLDSGFDFCSNNKKAGDNVFDALLYTNYSPDVVECMRLLIDAGGAKYMKNPEEIEYMVAEDIEKTPDEEKKKKEMSLLDRLKRIFGK